MKTLVIAEHDNKDLSSSTLCAIAAAEKIGQEIDVLVASNSNEVAVKAKEINAVSKVLSLSLIHI